MKTEFPKEDCFLDFEGNERVFDYLVHNVSVGYSVRARERKEDGYEFASFSESSPFNALGELRQKIRKRLSTRYLQEENGRTGERKKPLLDLTKAPKPRREDCKRHTQR